MRADLVPLSQGLPKGVQWANAPLLFSQVGDRAVNRLLQFLTAEIQNPHTRACYARAIFRFDDWCSTRSLQLSDLTPFQIAGYIEELGVTLAKPSVKQHLAALRMLFNYLVIGQIALAGGGIRPSPGPRHR